MTILPPENLEELLGQENTLDRPRGLNLKLDLIPFVGLPRYLTTTFIDLSYSKIRKNAEEIVTNSIALGLYTAVTSLWANYLLS